MAKMKEVGNHGHDHDGVDYDHMKNDHNGMDYSHSKYDKVDMLSINDKKGGQPKAYEKAEGDQC